MKSIDFRYDCHSGWWVCGWLIPFVCWRYRIKTMDKSCTIVFLRKHQSTGFLTTLVLDMEVAAWLSSYLTPSQSFSTCYWNRLHIPCVGECRDGAEGGWLGGWSLFAMRKPCRRSTNFRIILHKKQWRTDSVESRNQNSPNLHPLNTRWTRIPNAALSPLQRVRVWRPWANGAQGFKPIATQIPFTYERLQNRTIREVALALIPGDV